jgi:hypothetical protein
MIVLLQASGKPRLSGVGFTNEAADQRQRALAFDGLCLYLTWK